MKIILAVLLGFGFQVQGKVLPPPHDIHLSKCAITYQGDKNMLDIQWHIWLDDLAEGLKKFGAGDLQLLSDNEAENADEKLMEYLQTKMSISINGTPVKFSFIKKEASEDLLAVWVQLEVKNVASLKSIKIQNCLLMEAYSDQQNIVHIKGKDGRQGYLIFDSKDQKEEILF